MLIDPKSLLDQTVKDRYFVRKIIGQGGMGTVYLAWDIRYRREYALKLLLPQGASDLTTQAYQELRERFHREQKLLRKLSHEHILKIYDMGEYREAAYFIMDYFPAGSLYNKIRQHGKLSLQEACHYTKHAASALDYIHQHKIIHRDIKPQNMLLDSQDQLMLADFGVARIAGSLLTSSEQPGTKVYKSPEARNDEEPDPRDDIYSLGVVLYEMLTGNHPSSIQKDLETSIPPGVLPVIQKAMAKHRRERYFSAQDMAEDFEEAISYRATINRNQRFYYHGRPSAREPSVRQLFSITSETTKGGEPGKLKLFVAWGLAILACVLLSGFIFQKIAVSQPTSYTIGFSNSLADTPTPSPQEEALFTVQQYYSDWNNKDYQKAYNLLQSSYQQQYSFASLLASYQRTLYTCISIANVKLLQDGSVQVAVTDNAIETSLSGETVINLYHIVYSVIHVNNTWRLAPISLQREAVSGVCSK